ncbi:uncharacterized protein LOC134878570 [Eleginops maclovinus]|uniref:uncharacterized protein LOC134878570 n=1 Tax=Eleginops maclovinus TaxID=56733 RepID=UPI0030802A96
MALCIYKINKIVHTQIHSKMAFIPNKPQSFPIVTRQGFAFHEMDMPLIREWWCLLLMERFKIEGHGQRFAFWTTEAISLIKGDLPPVFRVPRQSGLTTQVPPHIQAVSGRTEAEKALVDFIVHSQGAEQHLMSILGGKPSKWAVMKQVPVYLDSEEEQKTLFTHRHHIWHLCLTVNAISWEEAEQVFLAGPAVDQSEVDKFCRRLERQMRKEGALP